MDQRTLLGRLLSPAGFALVLLFLFLPFVTVSCTDGDDTITTTFSGVDLALGNPPHLGVSSGGDVPDGSEEDAQEEFADEFKNEFSVDIFALSGALLAMVAMVIGVVRDRFATHAIRCALAVISGALLVAAVMRAPGQVEAIASSIQDEASAEALPSSSELRYGFWLTMIILMVLTVGHAVALVRSRRGGTTAPATGTEPATEAERAAVSEAADEPLPDPEHLT